MINVALAGAWHVHFPRYSRDVLDSKDCNVTAIWDDDKERGRGYAEEFGIDFEEDYDALLKRADVDAVVVCTSTDMHKDVIIRAANAGKHIFTEKVLCFNEKDALECAEAIERNNVKFCISFPWLSRSDFIFVTEAVEKGLIGKINYCRMRNAHNGASSDWLPESFYDKKTCGGGAMMDLGAHSMYILNKIMGRPVAAASAFTNVIVNSVEDNAVTVLRYENGAIGVSETGFVAENNPFELELVGDKGTILAGGFNDKLCYNIGDGWVFPKLPERRPDPIFMWIDAIKNGGEILYGVKEAVELSYIMELAYKNIF